MSKEAKLAPGVEDYAAVRKIIAAYCVAAITGEAPAWKKIFHESAVMNGHFKDGTKIMGSIDNLYKYSQDMDPYTDAAYEVDALQIVGDTAVGRCVLKNYGGKDYVDFFELLRDNGEWRIVAKTFQEI